MSETPSEKDEITLEMIKWGKTILSREIRDAIWWVDRADISLENADVVSKWIEALGWFEELQKRLCSFSIDFNSTPINVLSEDKNAIVDYLIAISRWDSV